MQSMHPESQTRQRWILVRVVVLLRWSVGVLFVLSGATKLFDINSFSQAVREFAVVDSALVPLLKYSIPVIEVILGGALVLNVRVVAVTNSLLALLALFTALIYEKLLEGMKISCGCFGDLSVGAIDWWTFARNISLILLVSIVAITHKSFSLIKGERASVNAFRGATLKARLLQNLRQHSFYLLGLFVFGLFVVLFIQNRTLKDRVELLSRDHYLNPGDIVTSINAVTLDGDTVTFDPGRHAVSLVFIMSTGCGYCQESIVGWNNLLAELAPYKIPTVGIALDSLHNLRQYRESHLILFPTFSTLEKRVHRIFKIQSIPMTVLLKAETVVVASNGEFDFRTRDAIFRHLRFNGELQRAVQSTSEKL